MKILVVTALWPTAENPAWGSFVHSQVECLRSSGIEVDVLVLDAPIRKLLYLKGIFELRARIRQSRPDLVHAHYGYVGLVCRTQWKIPLVVTYHGDDVQGTVDSSGKITNFSRLTASLCRSLGGWVDAAIVQTQQMAARFRSGNVHVIPHEVDFRIFHPTNKTKAVETLGLDPKKRYILFAADPAIAVKRFPLAKAAVEQLRLGRSDVELLVVSREPQARLALYMNACDALMFPSYQEGSPNVVKQAMACNLPIVATDVGDVREIIGSTAGCYTVEPNASQFASRLSEIIDSAERTQGIENVRHLDGSLVAARITRVYEEVLARNRGAFAISARKAA